MSVLIALSACGNETAGPAPVQNTGGQAQAMDSETLGGAASDNGGAMSGAGMPSAGQDGTSPESPPDGGAHGGAASASAGGTPGSEGTPGADGRGGDGPDGHETQPPFPLLNGVQWVDTSGAPIQAHGGGVLKVGDQYYWFGENRNPDGTFYAVSAYRSADLLRWEHVRDVLTMDSAPELRPANIERPKVVYNALTQKYVMWMHWENGKNYSEARAAVASSDTVDGEYVFHGSFRPLQDSGVVDHGKPGYMSRDCTLFLDDDGQAYFLSAANENYDLHLYQLSADFLSVERRAALLFEGGHREAPALFKRGATYFLLTSGATGWDPNQAQYATSLSLTDGWSALQDVGDETTYFSQSTFVLPIATVLPIAGVPPNAGQDETSFLYLGDRWARAWGDPVNESSYVWLPITFPTASTMTLDWANSLLLNPELGQATGSLSPLVLTNKKSHLPLSVDGSPTDSGSDLVQTSGATFQWQLDYDGVGYFRLVAEVGGKVVDVPDESTETGVHLHLWDATGADNQAWRLRDAGSGEYRLQNRNSGLYIGVADGSTSEGATVEQQAETGGDEQVWQIAPAPR